MDAPEPDIQDDKNESEKQPNGSSADFDVLMSPKDTNRNLAAQGEHEGSLASINLNPPGEIYYVSPHVVMLCAQLIAKFQANNSPDEFLKNELAKCSNWNEYDMYITVEMFFGCLDHSGCGCLESLIKTFMKNKSVKRLELTPCLIGGLKVIAYLVLFEAKRISPENMQAVLVDCTCEATIAYYKFLIQQCSPNSPGIAAMSACYVDEFIDESIMPNLIYSRDILKKVLPPKQSEAERAKRPLQVTPSDYIPFKHCFELDRKKQDRANNKAKELPKPRFLAKSAPKTTFDEPKTAIALQKEFVKNREKALNLLDTVMTLKHSNNSALYEENKKSEKYFRILEKIQEEREAQLMPCIHPSTRLPLQAVLQGPSFRGRINKATVVRQLETYRARHAQECAEIEKLLTGSGLACAQAQLDETEEKFQEEIAIKWARMLDAKLTYQRAIAASRDAKERNKEKAEEVRIEGEFNRERIAQSKQDALEKARMTVNAAIENDLTGGVRRAIEEVRLQKLNEAQKLKSETLKLQEMAVIEESGNLAKRFDKIQQIRAEEAVVLRSKNFIGPIRLNKYNQVGEMSHMETKIRLHLNRRNHDSNLKSTREKLREQKEKERIRFQQALEEIEWYRQQQGTKKCF